MAEYKTKLQRKRFYGSGNWNRIRKKVLERDNYECQWCRQEGRVTLRGDAVLEVDHIKELEHYPKLALDMNNLRVLCRNCHNKRHERFNYRMKNKKRKQKWNDEWFGD